MAGPKPADARLPGPALAQSLRRVRWGGAVSGAALGVLIWLAAAELGAQAVPLLRSPHPLPFAGLLGAFLGAGRGRPLLWVLAWITCGGLLVVGYTPLIVGPVRGLVRSDALRPVPALVVLSSDIQSDGELTPAAQGRILRGYEILAAGYAQRMILPQVWGRPSYLPTVRGQMRRLGLDWPLEEVGPVRNTRDEAVAVAELSRRRGWSEVILVTDPTHTRRAAAVFERAGLGVLAAPCADRDYDLSTLNLPHERLRAFRSWLYEVIGVQTYRLRGWI